MREEIRSQADSGLSAGRAASPLIVMAATPFGIIGAVFGLVPIILETSLQSQHIVPMAISLGFGIVFATAVTLVLVPCLYLVAEDLVGLARTPRTARAL